MTKVKLSELPAISETKEGLILYAVDTTETDPQSKDKQIPVEDLTKETISPVFTVNKNGASTTATVQAGGSENDVDLDLRSKGDGKILLNGEEIIKLPYKSYVAQLSQSGTSDPTANILNDISGFGAWVRDDEGFYYKETTGLIDLDKIHISGLGDFVSTGSPYFPIGGGAGVGVIGYYTMFASHENGNTRIVLVTTDPDMFYADLSTLIGTGKIYLPEIRIYN
jgi:hypothetical protein